VPGYDQAVYGNQLAGAHLDVIARIHGADRYFEADVAIVEAPGEFDEGGAAQSLGSLEGGALGALLHEAGAEQERDEGRQGVEVDRSLAADCGHGAEQERAAQGHGDRQVHVGDAPAQARPGRAEERPRREEDDWHRQPEAHPAEELLELRIHSVVLAGIERAVDEHDVHRAGPGHADLDQERPVLVPARLFLRPAQPQVRDVADGVERPGDLREGDVLGIPVHLGHGAREVEPHGHHAVERVGQFLHEPDAGCAVDPLEEEPRAPGSVPGVLHLLPGELRSVEVREATPADVRRLDVGSRLIESPVEALETPVVQDPVDLSTTLAAELLLVAVTHQCRRHLEAAVGTGVARDPQGLATGPDHGVPPPATSTRWVWTKRCSLRCASRLNCQTPAAGRRARVR